jgi:ubiquinone/menaquinone biosynthesis C-methylase UbiE
MTMHYTRLGASNESRAVHESHIDKMRDYYRRTAQRYNTWHCNLSDNVSHNYGVRQVLKLLGQESNSNLLDVGCGTGRCIKAALDAGYDAQGIDLCADLLAVAEKELGIPKERLHCGDATRLPFPDKSFDVTCILGGLHHSAMPHTIIAEMIRVTRRAMVVSDGGNRLAGGVRQILFGLGIFDPVYRLLFRREPKTMRRGATSEGDGPTFDFTVEEIMPDIKQRFAKVSCLPFYRFQRFQLSGFWLPRLFATHAVIVATS